MNKSILLSTIFALVALCASAQEFNPVPRAWKWLGNEEVIFTYNGSYEDTDAFVVNARNGKKTTGVTSPAKFSDFPLKPAGAVNLTYSPDSTKLAFTRDNDLYVVDIASGVETRLTYDGSDVILNGYASWVYYEEIFGRSSRYKAFWWSPDSKKIGFYRFDNSQVPMFPIYSAFANPAAAASQSQSPRVTDLALGGALSETRYPKAGQTNPQVRIGIVEIAGRAGNDDMATGNDDMATGNDDAVIPVSTGDLIWADFDPTLDQYFGIPFWGPDSKEFFIARMPRLQNTIDLYAVNPEDGSKRHVYNETYKTWLNWFDGVVFTDNGLYMAREFETGWQQIYFLSYDGKTFRRLTDGPNWNVAIVRVDEKKGDVYFTAKRDAVAKQALYKVDKKGKIVALTDPAYNATGVSFSPDGKYFVASFSNMTTPTKVAVFPNKKVADSPGNGNVCTEFMDFSDPENMYSRHTEIWFAEPESSYVPEHKCVIVADMQGPDYDPSKYALGELMYVTTPDRFTLPGTIVFPKNFNPEKKYPVHVDIYGGPNTPMVRDRWTTPTAADQWYSENGIIQVIADPRAAGHNGRTGLDMIYRQLTVWEVKDFCTWAEALQALPYVQADKIGVEGFSFGGTMTSMLLMQAPDKFHYGIAGGGVYDWALYDSHYTERYMDTPQNNPEGYAVSKVMNYVDGYPTEYNVMSTSSVMSSEVEKSPVEPVMLKLTHGTGDDNVHHQNTLQLLDAMHRAGKKFDFMIYPDGMHGYHGYQGAHFQNANNEFWLKYLKSE